MDEKSVSFQMFLILLSFITLGSESRLSVSSNVKAILKCLVFFRGRSMRRSLNLDIVDGQFQFFSYKTMLRA